MPIPSEIERFGDAFWLPRELRLEPFEPDATRHWFLNEAGTSLIQIQRDRFVVNWRKVRGDEIYPRYEKEVRPRFIREWTRFKQFVVGLGLGEIEVQQCEVTYVNDIPQAEGWQSLPEALRLLSLWRGGGDGFLPPLETLGVNGAFQMPEQRGRLHFAVQHRRRQIDGKEVIQLRLIARGKPHSGSDEDVLSWLDLGREWIVRGFADLTTPEAHELWRRRR